ncbi:efflux RND transporter periplasmic adaptor subunit [Hydrocarboniphaga sp.]|uniref:efflux RND transporter periplasmic adaptor subunit n=1 Tax=Hydrocarboniphaga sp. TaxID=2033016 RepID=UPI003D127F58
MQSSAFTALRARRQRGMARVGLIIVVVAAVLIAWGLYSRHRAAGKLEEATDAQIAQPVQVVKPQAAGGDLDLLLPGNVQALAEAPIYARTDGYLKRWRVDIGTQVKAGQELAEIDAPELDQQLRAAQADLASVEANEKIAQVTADRWRDLRESDSVSKQEADEKIAAAAASSASLNASRAEVQRLKELTGYKKIVAPFDGVITARSTDLGRLIGAGSGGGELFRIADMRSLRLYVNVPQQYAAVMKAGLNAEVRFPDRPTTPVTASVARTSGALDAGSRTLLAELKVDNADGLLLPGAYAEVRFKIPAQAGGTALLLPSNTLLFNGSGLRVATVGSDQKVVMKSVRLGRDLGTQIEVTDGVTADDQVVIAPSDSMTDGIQVRVVQPDAKADAKPDAARPAEAKS